MFLQHQTRKHKYIAGIFINFCCSICMLPSLNAQSSALLAAVKNNNLQELKTLIDQKTNVNVYDDDSDHALMYAALYASADCMELLLKKGADANATNKIGETPLMWCNHDLKKTKLLLQYGANVNANAKSGNTPLLIASVGAGQYEIIKLLIDKGADLLAINNRGETALSRVALFGDTASIRLFLNKGTDINAKNKQDRTVLLSALVNENKELVYWLLNNGADANIPDNSGSTPLFYAVSMNDVKIVQALLNKTTNINLLDIDGMTSLMWACYDEHDNTEVVQALLNKGAGINIKDKKGRTALFWALKKGNTKRVALLKSAGAEL